MGVALNLFLISALNEGDWLASRPVHFNPEATALCTHCIEGLGGPRAPYGRLQNIREQKKKTPLAICREFNSSLVVQPVSWPPHCLLLQGEAVTLLRLNLNLQSKNRFLAYFNHILSTALLFSMRVLRIWNVKVMNRLSNGFARILLWCINIPVLLDKSYQMYKRNYIV